MKRVAPSPTFGVVAIEKGAFRKFVVNIIIEFEFVIRFPFISLVSSSSSSHIISGMVYKSDAVFMVGGAAFPTPCVFVRIKKY